MERHFEKSLEDLKAHLFAMGERCQESLDSALQTMLDRDASLAEGTYTTEKSINADENRLDEMILDFLALNQPVAVDLRFILSLQDAVVDLERIGDHCVNIAQSATTLALLRSEPDLLVLPEMGQLAQKMLRDSQKAFLTRDLDLAHSVIDCDDRMDELNRETTRSVIKAVKEDRELIETGLEIIRISKNLERIGDLSVNIAEDAIFLVEARTLRHHPRDAG